MARRDSVAGTVADPVVEYATLEVDGLTYSLCWDFNAIAEAEKIVDGNLMHGIGALIAPNGSGMTAVQTRGLLYAAMRKAHINVTLKEAGHLIRIDTIVDVNNAIVKAYTLSLPPKKKAALDLSSATGESGSNAGPLLESLSD